MTVREQETLQSWPLARDLGEEEIQVAQVIGKSFRVAAPAIGLSVAAVVEGVGSVTAMRQGACDSSRP